MNSEELNLEFFLNLAFEKSVMPLKRESVNMDSFLNITSVNLISPSEIMLNLAYFLNLEPLNIVFDGIELFSLSPSNLVS